SSPDFVPLPSSPHGCLSGCMDVYLGISVHMWIYYGPICAYVYLMSISVHIWIYYGHICAHTYTYTYMSICAYVYLILFRPILSASRAKWPSLNVNRLRSFSPLAQALLFICHNSVA